jgi:hypothetical protein
MSDIEPTTSLRNVMIEASSRKAIPPLCELGPGHSRHGMVGAFLPLALLSAGKNMNPDHPEDFVCPQCQARYKIVRVAAEPGASDRTLYCRLCRQPLASIEGGYILKYFLVSRPRAGA